MPLIYYHSEILIKKPIIFYKRANDKDTISDDKALLIDYIDIWTIDSTKFFCLSDSLYVLNKHGKILLKTFRYCSLILIGEDKQNYINFS